VVCISLIAVCNGRYFGKPLDHICILLWLYNPSIPIYRSTYRCNHIPPRTCHHTVEHTKWTPHRSLAIPTATDPSASSPSSTCSRLSYCSFRPASLQAMLSLPSAWFLWVSRASSVQPLSAARRRVLTADMSYLELISLRLLCSWFS
jgi:hypothetical protein